MCLEGGGQKKILCWCEIFMKFQLWCPVRLVAGTQACLSFGFVCSCPELPERSRPAGRRGFAAAEAKLTSPKCLLFASFLGMFANLWAKTKLVFKWVLWRRGQESKEAEWAVWVKQRSLCQFHTMHFCLESQTHPGSVQWIKKCFLFGDFHLAWAWWTIEWVQESQV